MRRLSGWRRDQAGASALEFALVVPIVVALTLGGINLCLLLYANTTLHYAVDDAARCMSVKTLVCTSPGATQTYALASYKGPAISPTFTAVAAACGSQVTGTATYQLNAVLVNFPVAMSAVSCFHT